MGQDAQLLKDYTDKEKGAYLSAIASIATADRTASEDEMEFLEVLADSAELSPEEKERLHHSASNVSGDELKESLDILKGSELRFSLLADLVTFAGALGKRKGGGALGGLLGSVLGGSMGVGRGNLTGGRGRSSDGGGIGSLISMLNGGRGMNSTGGLLDKVLKEF